MEIKLCLRLHQRNVINTVSQTVTILCFNSILFTAKVQAIEQIWFIGNRTLNQGIRPLQEINKELKRNNQKELFMYENFGPHFYSSPMDPLTNSYVLRIRNCLAMAMNENLRIPSMIIVLTDKDMAEY